MREDVEANRLTAAGGSTDLSYLRLTQTKYSKRNLY